MNGLAHFSFHLNSQLSFKCVCISTASQTHLKEQQENLDIPPFIMFTVGKNYTTSQNQGFLVSPIFVFLYT